MKHYESIITCPIERKERRKNSWDTYSITNTYVLLKDLHTAIALENGRHVPLELWRDKYDLDPITETSCSEHRKKGSMKLVAPSW